MAAALKTLFGKQNLALAGARLRAWWEGAGFDEAAVLAAMEAKAANAALQGADDALFDAPAFEPPSRLAALELIWGAGRVRPAYGVADSFDPAPLRLGADGVLAVLGPGALAPLAAVAAAHPGRIDAFEWREEMLESLRHGLAAAGLGARVALARVDLEAHVFAPATYDALLSIDDFTYCSYPPHLAQQIAKSLKPGGRAVIEAYVGFKCAELATAFASSFAEPQIRPHGDLLSFFTDTGLAIEADEDLTEPFLDAARSAFRRLSEQLGASEGLDVLAARELAWEAEAWRMRIRLLTQRRLERRRFMLAKPSEAQAGKANAPAA